MTKRALSVLAVACLCVGLGAAAPPVSKAHKTGLQYWEAYIPKNLDDCFAEFKKKLEPSVIEKIRQAQAKDMALYHFGLGLTIRNGWGLWKGSRLSRWFNGKGIHHPDDMSGIILDSFWRHLHHQPIKLEEQIEYYQAYWKAAAEQDKEEKERVRRAGKLIDEMMIGLTIEPDLPQIVKRPPTSSNGLRARFLAPFRGGAFLSVRRGFDENFTTPGYFLDLKTQTIHPITIPELEKVQSAVVAGGVAYFSGTAGSKPVVVAIGDGSRSSLAVPEEKAVPQLGIAGNKLMAFYRNAVYVMDGGTWTKVYSSSKPLPKPGPPPHMFGNTVLIRDEGDNESDKRLWRLELGDKPQLISIDDETGVCGSDGPRWETCFSYCVTPEGDLWATLGMDAELTSLVKRSPNGQFRIAVMLNNKRFDGDILGGDKPNDGLSISALTPSPDGSLLAVSDHCLYRISGTRITKLVAFGNASQGNSSDDDWGWDPSDILELDGDNTIVSGMYGGIYLIRRNKAGVYSMAPLDEKVGKPVQF
jgi:hypothetical protein